MGSTTVHNPQEAITYALKELGLNLENENFKDTPKRWLNALIHYTIPYDPAMDLSKSFGSSKEGASEYIHAMVVQANIPYRAMCAHHLLPVIGVAHVGYIPRGKVVGLSKLARLVYGISHQSPSLQEDVGKEIADSLYTELDALGAMCVISATHGCMACRGIEEPNVATVTATVRGAFINKHETRDEFYRLVGLAKPTNI